MYPKYVNAHGGKDSLIKTIQNDNKVNEAGGAKLKSIIMDEPGKEAKYGNTIFSVIADSITFQYGPGTYYMKSAFIAISNDDGKSWTFASTADLNWLISVQPEVAKLNIPPTTPMQIISIDPSKQFPVQSTNNTPTIKYKLIGRRAIAMVVVTHNKEYLADTSSIRLIKDKWIKSMVIGAFTVNPDDTVKYGANAMNGVNKYIIDDEHYPKIYLQFIGLMKYVGPAD